MKNRENLERIIRKHTNPLYHSELLQLIRPHVRLRTRKAQKNVIGETKFGGQPHLPKDAIWPSDENEFPYTFIAQINLQDIHEYDLENYLPSEGILFFFLDLDRWGAGQVIYLDQTDNLIPLEIPNELKMQKKSFFQKLYNLEGRNKLINECGVDIYNEFLIPSPESLYLDEILFDKGPKERLNLFNERIYEEELLYDEEEAELTSNHHLLGYYNPVQHEYHELELIESETIKIENLSLNEINEALEWKLLFQLDSDDNLNLSIGDWGKIYFFIHQVDLEEKRFDKVKMVGVCH